MPDNLADVVVLVTRPAHQARGLVELIQAEGGRALQFPLLEIVAPKDLSQLEQALNSLRQYDLAIFVSQNAVEFAVPPILQRYQAWPANVEVAAVGVQTAEQLGQFCVAVQWQPLIQFGSESLLQTLESQGAKHQRVVIFRGNGGRELIADRLRQHGARVDYVECYRRVMPELDRPALIRLLAANAVDLIIITSELSLRNLYVVVGNRDIALLNSTAIMVLSDRLAKICMDQGHRNVLVANEASDLGIVDSIKDWCLHPNT